ncbi:hypothetical protein N9N28_10320 [Rubripirellula amarantea]|nr:hypothetical protein [Rubripirellula amarantea]
MSTLHQTSRRWLRLPQLCKECGGLINIDIPLLSGGLGPGHLRCGGCEDVKSTGRVEWHRMTLRERKRYMIGSLAFAILVSLLCYIGGSLLASQIGKPLSLMFEELLIGSVLTAVFAMQSLRIVRSIQRDSRGDISPQIASLSSIDSNAALPVIVAALLMALVVGANYLS